MRRRFFNNKNVDINNYLTIEALEDNLQVRFPQENLMYSIDGMIWQKLIAGQYSPPINAGQTISFKGNLTSLPWIGIGTFTITKRCNLLGNCMSMLFGDDAVNNYSLSDKHSAFWYLFHGCTTIIQVSESFLPATTLADSCYYHMFSNCTNLTTAPELPATTLADSCYYSMFRGCSSLVNAPSVLPATTLADRCYYEMFLGCRNLNYIKMLATDISASNCLNSWVNGVASTGTFVKNPAITSLPTGDSGIPSGWTVKNYFPPQQGGGADD